MKRVLAMLLAVAMLAALLCGCASEGNKETQQTQQPQATEVAAEENVTEAQKPATATGTPKEIVETLVGDLLDLSAYEVVNEDEDLISYCNLDLYTSFPYEITLYDMKFQLDGVSTYQDILDGGWTFNFPETAEASCQYLNHARDSGRNFILSITLVNLKDEDIPIEEAYLTRVDGEIENGETFIFGTITESSSPADVIQAFGTPYQVIYTEASGLHVIFHDDGNPSSYGNEAAFHFNNDGVITQVKLGYDYHNLV